MLTQNVNLTHTHPPGPVSRTAGPDHWDAVARAEVQMSWGETLSPSRPSRAARSSRRPSITMPYSAPGCCTALGALAHRFVENGIRIFGTAYERMDLAEDRSFVQHAVSRGNQFFTISWRNPGPEHADWDLELYAQSILDPGSNIRRGRALGPGAAGVRGGVHLG